MTEGVDYAWSRPDPAGLCAAGKRFASRYLSYDNTGKNLTLEEAERLAAAGIAVVANWEWQTGDAKGGFAVGQRYAAEAVRQAAACGMPAGRPIYFSVDYDPAGSYGPVDAYFQGIATVLPVDRIGAYGGYDTIDHLLGAGLVRWAWQTYAWSGGRWHPGAHVQQYRNGVLVAGGDVDLDRAMVADFGQWTPGEDMPLSDDDIKRITEAVWQYYLAPLGINMKDHILKIEGAVGEILTLVQASGGDRDAAAIIAAVRGEADAVKAEVRDAVADLGEGGATQVRNDPDA